MDNPHYSSGSNGVIAKARFVCTGSASEVYYDVYLEQWGGCTSTPPADPRGKAFGSYGCKTFVRNGYGLESVGAGQTVTRYVPNPSVGSGDGQARLKGKWRAYVVYSYVDDGPTYYKASQVVTDP